MGNHNSGRRPEATALTVLRGNPSKKRINTREPAPPAGNVEKPAGLSAGAGAVWDELAPICLAMRTLTVADVRPFARLCELEATLSTAASLKGYQETWAAAVKLEKAFSPIIRPYYELFGLTPVSRARISVPREGEQPVSKWAGALK